MKNNLLLAILLLFAGSQIYAQGVRFGFKAGVNFSQISSYEFDAINIADQGPGTAFSSVEDSRIGFSATFLAEIPLGDVLSFQPEFGFSSQGNKNEAVRFDYLQLPLGLKFNFNKLFVIAGPQAGIKISNFEQSDNYESLDFSAFGGIGYHFTENIFLEARFTKGFTEIFADDSMIAQPIPTTNPDDGIELDRSNFLIKNTGTNTYINISVGYRL